MHMELRKMADFCYIQEMASKAHFGLGNRCSVQLSYGGRPEFPRFPPFPGQCETRETRKSQRFARAHQVAQSVRESFSRIGGAQRVPHPSLLAEIDRLNGGAA